MLNKTYANKTIIFGAGDFGVRYLLEMENLGIAANVLGILDNNKKLHGLSLLGRYPCYPPEQVSQLEYDRIIIANNTSEDIRSDIFIQLEELGVSADRIGFFPTRVFHESLAGGLDPRIPFLSDFARFAEEQNISGNVAECGVYRGGTAKHMNVLFPDKRLYLFDTFAGFAQQDIEAERALGDPDFIGGLADGIGLICNPSTDLVMMKMLFPDNVIIKRGRVPESFEGVEDVFCFVNLDMDLYQPMLSALDFFWDKMSEGGMLLLHNYYTPCTPGVKKAVDVFEAQLGRRVPKIPVCNDSRGGKVRTSIALIKDYSRLT